MTKAFDVYAKWLSDERQPLDTIFCAESVTAEECYRGLVDHDGYSPNIWVVLGHRESPEIYVPEHLRD